MQERLDRIVNARWFEYALVLMISGSAIAQGVSFTVGFRDEFLVWFVLLWLLTISALVLEVIAKLSAHSPRVYRYFMDAWNVYDFLVVCFLIISWTVLESLAVYGPLTLLVRLLRLLRGIATIREMRLVLTTLLRSIPSLVHIVLLLGIIMYAYALVGIQIFSDHDPDRWGHLGLAAWTLFQVVTMDDWAGITRPLLDVEPAARPFFLSFVIISGFVVANIFVAIIISHLQNDGLGRRESVDTPESNEEIVRELRATRESLRRLEQRLDRTPD